MSELGRDLAWAEQGAELFLSCQDELPDAALTEDSGLPGWTLAHIVAHVGYNAQALSRLVHWARTGVETPMYASREARNEEIENGTQLPADQLRSLVRDTDARLRADFAELDGKSWQATVTTAQGLQRPANQLPWMRTREVWIHAVDLGGADFRDFPAELLDALLSDLASSRRRQQREPALRLHPTDRARTWRVELEHQRPWAVRGSTADLCRWLTGRGANGLVSDGHGLPELGRWL